MADIILRYKEVMSAEELVALEDLTKMSFITDLESLSSFPNITVNDGVDSFVVAFIDLQKKFLEVEQIFHIKK